MSRRAMILGLGVAALPAISHSAGLETEAACSNVGIIRQVLFSLDHQEIDDARKCQSQQAEQSCTWAFPYRDPAAQTTFAAAVQTIQSQCLVLRDAKQAAPVNHPDTYDAWTFTFDHSTTALSLKDKANLQKTFLTWRHMPR